MVKERQDLLSSELKLPHTFAKMLMAAFLQAGESRTIRYDETTFTLVIDGDDGAFWIGNLFTEFLRTKVENWKVFFENAGDVWYMVQDDLPTPPRWIPEVFTPFRDQTHPLSYRVEEVANTHLWSIAPPFDEKSEFEAFDLIGAYKVWWSNQFQRACKTHLRNVYRWLKSGQVGVEGLCILSDLRRMWRQGQLFARTDEFQCLVNELKFLGSGPTLPPTLSSFLDAALTQFGSWDSAALAFQVLREQCS